MEFPTSAEFQGLRLFWESRLAQAGIRQRGHDIPIHLSARLRLACSEPACPLFPPGKLLFCQKVETFIAASPACFGTTEMLWAYLERPR